VLAHLGTALLRTDGIPAFSATLDVASQWLSSYWKEAYPLVDDDGIDRRNALNYFADQMAVVDAIRRVPLVKSPQHGTFSVRDIDLATGQMPVRAGDPGRTDQRGTPPCLDERHFTKVSRAGGAWKARSRCVKRRLGIDTSFSVPPLVKRQACRLPRVGWRGALAGDGDPGWQPPGSASLVSSR
jgi:hypothetical protein